MTAEALKLQLVLQGLRGQPSRRQFNRKKDAEHFIEAATMKLHLTTVWAIDLNSLGDSKSAGWTYTPIENVH